PKRRKPGSPATHAALGERGGSAGFLTRHGGIRRCVRPIVRPLRARVMTPLVVLDARAAYARRRYIRHWYISCTVWGAVGKPSRAPAERPRRTVQRTRFRTMPVKRISVDKVEIGMYVSSLDRPWRETPFLFQGFLVREQEEVDQLRRLCRHVFILLPDRSEERRVGRECRCGGVAGPK